jgi:nucleoside-diphosphate-sugar epimerase
MAQAVLGVNLMHTPTFITGATGSIGFALAKRLSDSGTPIRAMVRDMGRAEQLRPLANVELVPGDLARPGSLRGLLDGCGVVYHCAAKILGSDPAAYQAINVGGTMALLDEAMRAGVKRFVYISTIAVYGFDHAENITEDYAWPITSNLYSLTKQAAERAVWAVADRLPVVIARPGDTVGPNQYSWTVQFVERITQGLLRPPLKSESGTLNPVYIDNLVDALLLLGTHPAAVGQAFNVVDGTPILMCDYIRLLAQMAGRRVFPVPAALIKGAAMLLALTARLRGREAMATPESVRFLLHKATFSAEKLRSTLRWSPAVSWEEGLRRTEVWLRSEGYIPDRAARAVSINLW